MLPSAGCSRFLDFPPALLGLCSSKAWMFPIFFEGRIRPWNTWGEIFHLIIFSYSAIVNEGKKLKGCLWKLLCLKWNMIIWNKGELCCSRKQTAMARFLAVSLTFPFCVQNMLHIFQTDYTKQKWYLQTRSSQSSGEKVESCGKCTSDFYHGRIKQRTSNSFQLVSFMIYYYSQGKLRSQSWNDFVH